MVLSAIREHRKVLKMMQEATKNSPVGLALLIGLNLIPLVGVLNWGWQSFDLIFLYWMENLVIGVFTFARMVARPYGHALDLIFPLFLAPFFAFHYGMFCWGHGTFVISLFGPEAWSGFELLPAIMTMLAAPTMLFALVALALIQAMDWIRDVKAKGFGADGVKDLMMKPYRRIVVLHVSIIATGFALAALEEPLAGLIILVVVKTVSDVHHWRKDEAAESESNDIEMSAEAFAKIAAEYPRPVVTVNGQEKEFESFEALRNSKEFRMALAVMRMVGGGSHMAALNQYLDTRIAEERGEKVDWPVVVDAGSA
jgi:hypothetical protein